MKKYFAAALMAMIFCGCKPARPPEAQAQPPAPPKESVASEVGGVIDYGIGATQVKALQKSKTKIQQINDQHQKDLDDAMK